MSKSVGVVGTVAITGGIFDRWGREDDLFADLQQCCEILELRTGLKFELSQVKLSAAHTAWQQEWQLWLQHLLPPETVDLSHLKKAAIFIGKMCEFNPITVLGEGYKDSDKKIECIQDGDPFPELPNRLPEKEIRNFRDGGCAYVCWLIMYHVCEFFEKNRTDRLEPYEPRITSDFEKDVVSALLSGKVSAQALHVILKALFLRD